MEDTSSKGKALHSLIKQHNEVKLERPVEDVEEVLYNARKRAVPESDEKYIAELVSHLYVAI